MYENAFYEYLSSEKRYSVHTVIAYQTDVKQFYEFLENNYEISNPAKVSPSIIRTWITDLMELKISPRSINRKLSTLKTFYRFLRKNGHVTLSPLEQIVPPKTNKRLPEFVNEEKMDLFLNEEIFSDDFTGIRNRLVIELLYNTGMRLSELTNLNS